MRSIKFRAWFDDEKAMIPFERLHIELERGEYTVWYSLDGDTIEDGLCVEDFIFMQYTGLEDIAEKDIYEGDVIICDRNINDRFDKTTFEVKFNPKEGFYGESKAGCTVYGEDFDVAEIVGNIYENPELLRGLRGIM